MSLRDLYDRYSERVQFLMVYIREAHPTDGWYMGRHEIRNHRSIEERREVAGQCELTLQYGIPTLVDEMDDAVMTAYAAHPDRLCTWSVATDASPTPAAAVPSASSRPSWPPRSSASWPPSDRRGRLDSTLQTIPLLNLLAAFAPSVILLAVMLRWSLGARSALYANARMLLQLLAVGYVLTFVFETDEPAIVLAVVAVMILASSWIALRPLRRAGSGGYPQVLVAIASSGGLMLVVVTQVVLDLPRWFEPNIVVPLAGMIFANAMNTVSLCAERFEAESGRGAEVADARRDALDAALIPQINGLLAVGIVSLPGMMTGQILSGVDPLVAVRYQIMVMCMVFGSGGLGAVLYLVMRTR